VKPELILLGKRVHDLRVERAWSREQLAVLCSFHVTYIGQVERGEKNLSFENLMKFSRAFDVTVSALLAGLETGTSIGDVKRDPTKALRTAKDIGASSAFQARALVKRLMAQRTGMDRTIALLAGAISSDPIRIRKARSSQPKPRRR